MVDAAGVDVALGGGQGGPRGRARVREARCRKRRVDAIRRHGLSLKGPTADAVRRQLPHRVRRLGGDGSPRSYPSVTVALRKELGLFVNVRPVRNYPGIPSRFRDVDLVIFRENSEDLYLGIERMRDADTAEATKIITRGATERVARFALDYMQRTGRKRVSIIHKSNILKLTDGLFLEAARGVLEQAPDIEVEQRVVDALCMDLVMKPETYDCLLLPNLYGDIVSDLAAGLVGGLGVAPGANIGTDCAMFEAVHGTRARHRRQGPRQSDGDDPVGSHDAALHRGGRCGRPHRERLVGGAGRQALRHARPRRHGRHPRHGRFDRRAPAAGP